MNPSVERVDQAIRDLVEDARRIAAADFPRAGDPVHLPGLYAWYVDAPGSAQLSVGLSVPVAPGLIYAGQAGAGASTATLRSRIRGNHLGGSITGSTFRLTLASILATQLGLVDTGGRALEHDGEGRLSAWMREHLAVAVTPEPDRARLAALEGAVLAQLDPPLNLQGMGPSPVRSALAGLRRARSRGRTGGMAPLSERIALVGCVKTKRKGTFAAQDLYASPLFRKRRAYVEAAGLRWWILSAEHGLVAPRTPLRDYERTLNAMSTAERRAWGARVLAHLRGELGDLGRYTFEIHAGRHYTDAIAADLRSAGATVEIPTAGLGLGRQLRWYGLGERSGAARQP